MAVYRVDMDDNGAVALVEEENGTFGPYTPPPWVPINHWLMTLDEEQALNKAA